MKPENQNLNKPGIKTPTEVDKTKLGGRQQAPATQKPGTPTQQTGFGGAKKEQVPGKPATGWSDKK